MKLEGAIRQINVSAVGCRGTAAVCVDVRVQLVLTLLFIIVVLSIPIGDPASLLWLFCYPIVMSEALGMGYGRIFRRSLLVLPLLLLIGLFNPVFDKAAVWHIGAITIDHGWLTFGSLVLRGLLAFQALLILVDGCGFYDICRSLQYFKCPKVLVTQLLMLYRYMGVLLSESLNMHRARQARGFGRKHYPLKMWGVFIGQLLIRSMQRARRINRAMEARGFSGAYHFKSFESSPSTKDYVYLCLWAVVLVTIRVVDFTAIFAHLLHH